MRRHEEWTLVLIAGAVFGVSYLYGNARFRKAVNKGTYYTSDALTNAVYTPPSFPAGNHNQDQDYS